MKHELLLNCESLSAISRHSAFVEKLRYLGMYQPAVTSVSTSRRLRGRSLIVVHLFRCVFRIDSSGYARRLQGFFLSIAMLRQPQNQHVKSAIEFGKIAEVYFTRSK